MNDEMPTTTVTPAPTGNPGQCFFCQFETSELTRATDLPGDAVKPGESPEVWECGTCHNTVPHAWLQHKGWMESRRLTKEDLGHDTVLLLAAINYGTNVVLEDEGKVNANVEHWIAVLESSTRDMIGAALQAIDVKHERLLAAIKADIGAVHREVMRPNQAGWEKIERNASPQVTEDEREKVREVLKTAAETYPEGMKPLMFAALLYRMSELVADARAGR